MARINIEDSFWSDPRFMRLCVKLGDERTAVGAVILAWKVAQKHWCPKKRPIPLDEWVHAGIGREIIDVGLAKETEDGVYVSGSEAHFEWYFERVSASRVGGKKSAETRKRKYGSAQPQTKTPKCPEVGLRELPKQNEASSSSSSSSSSSVSSSTSTSSKIHNTYVGVPPTPDLKGLWEEHAPRLTQIREMTAKRSKAWSVRWREKPSLDYWLYILQTANASSFLAGDNDRGWRADVDWFLKRDSHVKIAEKASQQSKNSPEVVSPRELYEATGGAHGSLE